MRILVAANNFPSTTRMPGSPRLFNLCRQLARQHELTLAFCPRSPEMRQSFEEDPDNRGVFSFIEELPIAGELGLGSTSWWRRQVHRLLAQPYYSDIYRCPSYVEAVRNRLERLAQSRAVDLVYLDGAAMTQFIGPSLRLPLAIDFCDCLSFLFHQEARLERRLKRKAALHFEGLGIGCWEKQAAARAAVSMVISPKDEEELLRLAPQAHTLIVANGIDVDYFKPSTVRASAPLKPRLVFTGVMGYGPNADAALYFASEVFPLIRSRFPDAQFRIVGASPPPEVQALNRQQGVHVTGLVDDIRVELEAADIFVCPLRFGTGMKNKILAALAMDLPVAATSLSLLGLPTEPGTHVLTADSPAEFCSAVERLSCDDRMRSRLKENGRSLVCSQCSWQAQGTVLLQALENVVRL